MFSAALFTLFIISVADFDMYYVKKLKHCPEVSSVGGIY